MRRSANKPTSTDVAREAGVSQSTVSYVLSGSARADRFSVETRRRVLAAASRLGYQRDSAGTALKRGYSDTLVLLAVTWHLATAYSHIMMLVSRSAAARGLSTIVHIATDDEDAETFVDHVRSLIPYGLLVLWDSNALPMDKLRELRREGLPIVDLMPGQVEGVVSITTDREEAFFKAVRHLTELGHRKIGLIYNTVRSRTSTAKLAGYKRGLESADIEFAESFVHETACFSFDAGTEGLRSLLGRHPDMTGVVCGSDPIALGAILAARDTGMTVPDDISIIGFGDQLGGEHFSPSLTTLDMPPQKLAQDVVEILTRMRTDPDYQPQSINEHPKLILRQSTGPVREDGLPAGRRITANGKSRSAAKG